MNQKGFANIILIVLVVILAGTVGYLAFNQKSHTPTPIPSPTPTRTPSPTPSPTPTPEPKNNTVSVSLGQQFTLKQSQVAKITNTGLEIEITQFYNSPCKGECFWSGVGIGFEYRFNGEVQKGINLVQAFGYQTTIVKTDHETYANLVVEKMK